MVQLHNISLKELYRCLTVFPGPLGARCGNEGRRCDQLIFTESDIK